MTIVYLRARGGYFSRQSETTGILKQICRSELKEIRGIDYENEVEENYAFCITFNDFLC